MSEAGCEGAGDSAKTQRLASNTFKVLLFFFFKKKKKLFFFKYKISKSKHTLKEMEGRSGSPAYRTEELSTTC